MSFYTTLSTVTVLSNIKKFGKQVTVRRVEGAEYDQDEDSMSGGKTTTFTTYAVSLDYKQSEIDGVLVIKNDKKMLIPGTVTIKNEDVIDGWTVVNVDTLSPAGIDVMHTCQVRQ